jgi:hypothetical protein
MRFRSRRFRRSKASRFELCRRSQLMLPQITFKYTPKSLSNYRLGVCVYADAVNAAARSTRSCEFLIKYSIALKDQRPVCKSDV